jgi:nucleoid-associated protein YgaU
MHKDLKIGLAVGLGLAAAAVLWVATRPSMSPQARIQQLHEGDAIRRTDAEQEPAERRPSRENEQPPVSVIARSPDQSGNPTPAMNRPTEPNSAAPAATRNAPPTETPAEKIQAAVEGPQPLGGDSTIHEQTEKIQTERFHIVRKGETLSKISLTYYGSAGKWQKIFEANKQTLKDPNRLAPGTKLTIPD